MGATFGVSASTARELSRRGSGHRFQPGRSGNPGGRPKGSRDKALLALEALLDGEGEKLTRKAVELALAGDVMALRLCLERILPPRKDRPVKFPLPDLKASSDAVLAMSALAQGVAEGLLTPMEASELSKLVETFVKAIDLHDIQRRLEFLEASLQRS